MSYNKLIKFKTRAKFNEQLKNIPNTSIVFIEDTGELWTHGKFYAGTNHNHNGIYLPIDGTAKAAEKLSNIITSFNGKYPVTVNVDGIIYSHTGLQFEGSTGTLTATKFVGALEGNAATVTNGVYLTATQTLTNKTLTAPIIHTIVNQGYKHRLEIGRPDYDRFDFYEYGGIYNFYKCTDATGAVKTLLGKITTNGWEGNVKGNVTGNVSGSSGSCTGNAATVTNGVYTNTAQTISGKKTFSAQQAFTVAQGTAPFTVTSNTKVANLNADLLDGLNSLDFAHTLGQRSFGSNNDVTTAEFVELLKTAGMFRSSYNVCRGSWHYAGQVKITDTGLGIIGTAGSIIEVVGSTSAYTIRITLPTTSSGGTTNQEYIYVNNGADYAPGWRRVWNNKNFDPDTKANLASPSFTGIPTAPTAAAKTNTTQIATTAFVRKEVSDLVGGAPETLDTLKEISDYLTNGSVAGGIVDQLGKKLNKTGDTMTGSLVIKTSASQLELNNNGGGNVDLTFKRTASGQHSWRLINSGGTFVFNKDDGNNTYYDTVVMSTSGIVNCLKGLQVNGQNVWHSGNFNPNDKLNLTGGTLTGILTTKDIIVPTGNYIYGVNESSGAMLQFDGNRTILGSVGASSTQATHIRSKTAHLTCGSGNAATYNIWDSGNSNLSTIDWNAKNLKLTGNSGVGDVQLEFWRGSNASWKLLNTGGVLKFQSNYISSAGNYYDAFTLTYSSGNAWLKGLLNAVGGLQVNGQNVWHSGNLTGNQTGHVHNQYYDSNVDRTKNTVLAAPATANGKATFRALVEADLPTHSHNYIPSTLTDIVNIYKKIGPDNTSSYLKSVVLLMPALVTTNWYGMNHISGTFTFFKKGGNVYDSVDIIVNYVYNRLAYSLKSHGQNGEFKLGYCTYNGIKYLCLVMPYHANPYTNAYFRGIHESTVNNNALGITYLSYYNENTKTPVIEEINNTLSLTLIEGVTTSVVNYNSKINNGVIESIGGFKGSLTGNSSSATKLTTKRKINGTDFDGTADITTSNWGTSRTLTIGSSAKSVNGVANVTWTLDEIGAAPAVSGGYLPLTGGTLSGRLYINQSSGNPGVQFNVSGTNKGVVGYHPSIGGIFLYNTTASKHLFFKDDGKLYIENTEISINGHTHNLLSGNNYISGGNEKPNYFGAGKLKYQMLSGSNLGNGSTAWYDCLWISSYTGGDVKSSTLISISKGDPANMFVSTQNYDSTSWGTQYRIWNSKNSGTTAYNWSAKSLTLAGGISGATAIASTATLDINATNDIRLRAGARSLVLTSTYLKPYDVDHNTMSLGTSGARWSTIYGTSLNLNGTISGATTITSSGEIAALKNGRAASFGGTTLVTPNGTIANQTGFIQIMAGTGSASGSSGLIFHNPGISTAALEYKNTDVNNGYFNFRSDDTNWNLRVNNNEVWHRGNSGSISYDWSSKINKVVKLQFMHPTSTSEPRGSIAYEPCSAPNGYAMHFDLTQMPAGYRNVYFTNCETFKINNHNVWHAGNLEFGTGQNNMARGNHTHDLGNSSFAKTFADSEISSTTFRTTVFGDNAYNHKFRITRWGNVPSMYGGMAMYGTAINWAGGDTQGFLAIDYNSQNVRVGGGNADKLNWTNRVVLFGQNIGTASTQYAAGDHGHPGLGTNGWGGITSRTAHGYIEFGPANGSHAHIYTDRSSFYFNKDLLVNGNTVWNTSNLKLSANDSSAPVNCNDMASNGLRYYTSGGPTGMSTNDGALYSQAYSTAWAGQIAQDYRNGKLAVRGKNNGTWSAWLKFSYEGHTHTFQSLTGIIVAGNEFNFVPAGYNNAVHINHKANGQSACTVTEYIFKNGNGGYANVSAAGFKKNGSSDSYVLLGAGGHKAISDFDLSKYLGIDNNIVYGRGTLQFGQLSGAGGTGLNNSTINNPTSDWYSHIILNHANSNGYYYDIACPFHQDELFFRRMNNGTLSNWRKVWHNGNHGTGSGLDADLLDGLHLHTGRNNEANKVVRTDGNGYIQAGYINSSSGNENNNSNPDRVWGSNATDGYLRTYRTSALSVGDSDKLGGVSASTYRSYKNANISGDNTAKWIRICELDFSNTIQPFGTFTIFNGYNHNPSGCITFMINCAGYRGEGSLLSITQLGGGSGLISKARIIFPHSTYEKGFLDIQYSGGVTNNLEVILIDSYKCKLIDFIVNATIPSTHKAKEQSFVSNGISAVNFVGALSGNASTATKLSTPRAINGTNFDGSAAITTANWGTARNLTIGNTAKSVNGGGNVSWTLAEIGAAPAVTGGYLPLSGGTITGKLHIGGTANLSSPWGTNNLTVGADGKDKVVMGYLTSGSNLATIGAHVSDLSNWSTLAITGTEIQFRIGTNEPLKAKINTNGIYWGNSLVWHAGNLTGIQTGHSHQYLNPRNGSTYKNNYGTLYNTSEPPPSDFTNWSSYTDSIHWGHDGGVKYKHMISVHHSDKLNIWFSTSYNNEAFTSYKLWHTGNFNPNRLTGNLIVAADATHGTGSSISLAIGDSDTGFHWNSDGNVTIKANGVNVATFYNNSFDVANRLKAGRIECGYEHNQANSIGCSNWFRSSGNTGWYSGSYGGGIYMSDSTWIRTFGTKKFYCDNTSTDAIKTAGGICADSDIQCGRYLKTISFRLFKNITDKNAFGIDYGPNPNYSRYIWFNDPDGSFSGYSFGIRNTERLWIDSTGCTSIRFNQTSDRRLKENIIPLENSLTKISRLKPVKFNFIGEDRLELGFIAQEMQQVYPELVTPGKDGILSLNYIGLISVLTKTVQELTAKVAELEYKVNTPF